MNNSAVIRNQILVLEIAQGFFQSEITFALLKLRVFERLDIGPKTADELAAEIGGRADYLERLLEGGRSLKLLERTGAAYRLSELSRSVLAPSAGENYLGNWLRWLEYLRGGFVKLDVSALTGSQVVERQDHLGGNPEDTREFVLAMHNYAVVRGRDFAESLDVSGCATMLDVACGPGTYAFQLAVKNPDLRLHLLDFPKILDVAREVEQKYALKHAVQYLPQDALKDPISGQYDLVLVSNMLQMLGEAASRELLAKLFTVTRENGSLVIQGQFLDEPEGGAPQRWPVIVDLLHMAMTRNGRNHTVSETVQWLKDAGFTRIEASPRSLLGPTSYVRGYRL